MKKIGQYVIMKESEVPSGPSFTDLKAFTQAFLGADWSKGLENAKAKIAELTVKVTTLIDQVSKARVAAKTKKEVAYKVADQVYATDNKAADAIQAQADAVTKELAELKALFSKFETA